MTIEWTNARRKLGELVPNPDNPRFIREANARRLAASVDEFGQPETIAIGPANELYNGHQRHAAWLERYGPDYEVDVRVASRPLTHDEWRKLVVILHDGTTGEWDMEAIANIYDPGELREWGFPSWKLPVMDDDLGEGDALDLLSRPMHEIPGVPSDGPSYFDATKLDDSIPDGTRKLTYVIYVSFSEEGLFRRALKVLSFGRRNEWRPGTMFASLGGDEFIDTWESMLGLPEGE